MTGTGDGVTVGLGAADLVGAIRESTGIAMLKPTSLGATPSVEMRFDEVAAAASAIRSAVRDDVSGIVVTQGTDTVEESAFLLDLLLDVHVPVAVTCALRNTTLAGADGPANLLAAIRVASSSEASGLGVVVVANDEIHAARYVRKTHISKPSAFTSPSAGPLGCIIEDRVHIFFVPTTGSRSLHGPVPRPSSR